MFYYITKSDNDHWKCVVEKGLIYLKPEGSFGCSSCQGSMG